MIYQRIPKQIIPFAVRWYTGEAYPAEEDEDEDDDEDWNEDEEEDDAAEELDAEAKENAEAVFAGKGGKLDLGGKEGENGEECKQQ